MIFKKSFAELINLHMRKLKATIAIKVLPEQWDITAIRAFSAQTAQCHKYQLAGANMKFYRETSHKIPSRAVKARWIREQRRDYTTYTTLLPSMSRNMVKRDHLATCKTALNSKGCKHCGYKTVLPRERELEIVYTRYLRV